MQSWLLQAFGEWSSRQELLPLFFLAFRATRKNKTKSIQVNLAIGGVGPSVGLFYTKTWNIFLCRENITKVGTYYRRRDRYHKWEQMLDIWSANVLMVKLTVRTWMVFSFTRTKRVSLQNDIYHKTWIIFFSWILKKRKEGLKQKHSWLSWCLQHWHPLWVSVHIPAAVWWSLLVCLEKQEMAQVLECLEPRDRLRGISWFLALTWSSINCCGHWGINQQMEDSVSSLSL